MQYCGIERRYSKRGDAHFKFFVHLPGPRIITEYTDNLSENGLRAVFDEKLDIDSTFDFEIFLTDTSRAFKGKPVWIRQIPSAIHPGRVFYDTGIQIIS
jgi:hypothetical protein